MIRNHNHPGKFAIDRSINQQLTYCFCRKLFFSRFIVAFVLHQASSAGGQVAVRSLGIGRETLEALAGARRSSLPSLFRLIFSNK